MIDAFKNRHIKFLIIIAYAVIGWYFVMNWLPQLIVMFLPFILAYFVASMTQPLVRLLHKRLRFKQTWASRAAWAVALILFFGVLGFVVAKIILELIKFANNSPMYMEKATNAIMYWNDRFVQFQNDIPPEFVSIFNTAMNTITQQTESILKQFSQGTVNWITNFATSLPGTMLFWLVFIVSSYFMCIDFSSIKKSLALQIPMHRRGQARQIKEYASTAVAKYFRGMGIILSISFTVILTGLLILQVDYAFLIALLLATLEVLPLIGTGIILNPWGVITIMQGNYPVGIGLIVLYIANVVIRQLVEPKIMSKSLGLYPIITLIAMYIGLKTFGFAGIILFPVVALVFISLQRAGVIRFWKTE